MGSIAPGVPSLSGRLPREAGGGECVEKVGRGQLAGLAADDLCAPRALGGRFEQCIRIRRLTSVQCTD